MNEHDSLIRHACVVKTVLQNNACQKELLKRTMERYEGIKCQDRTGLGNFYSERKHAAYVIVYKANDSNMRVEVHIEQDDI